MKFLRSRKYYATSAGIRNLKRALDKQKALKSVIFISHIAEKKNIYRAKIIYININLEICFKIILNLIIILIFIAKIMKINIILIISRIKEN